MVQITFANHIIIQSEIQTAAKTKLPVLKDENFNSQFREEIKTEIMDYLENNISKNIIYQNPWVKTQFVSVGKFVSLHIITMNQKKKMLSIQFKEVKITNQECKRREKLC